MKWLNKLRWANLFAGLLWLRSSLKRRITPAAGIIFPSPIALVNRIDYILQYCSGKTVLHFGFTDYPYTREKIDTGELLHLQLKKVTKYLFGIDNQEVSLNKYIQITGDSRVSKGDILDKESLKIIDQSFDIVLLGEILEHLKDPHQAIENLYNIFPPATVFLVTVPNYTSLNAIAGSLHGKEMIHPDHYWYFSPVTLLRLFPDDKFEIDDVMCGMYFQKDKRINFVLQKFPLLGDCIIGAFKRK
ncbi:methyltransferase domain-containing protein [Agriterribacter sp.]|uniref:methyltransferase domain-containing protein n=1 Tax=Agriterribacter sp. TaxID=2821509 RepID=UPI002BE4EBD5|nr:methyltransferase domain-containing protein [Agriterribacter sp.]HTN06233.1 methyltransferase domain-containing protein [Agriterribacter sp.]